MTKNSSIKKDAETGGVKKSQKTGPVPTETGTTHSSKKVEVTEKFTSYDIFSRCIKRARNLVDFHKDTEKETGKEEHYCDAYRAAVVLSISALDAFVRTLVIEKIKNILHGKKPIPANIRDYLKNLLNQDKLLDAARNYNLLETVEKALREDFAKKSFQGEWKITYYMELAGHSKIFEKVAIEAELNETTLTSKIQKFTKRRHIIAHSGDYELNQTVQYEFEIDKPYANECIDLVTKFAKSINKICLPK